MEITKHLFRSKLSLSIPYCSKILLCYLKPAFNGLPLFLLGFQFNLMMMHVQSKTHKTIFWQMYSWQLIIIVRCIIVMHNIISYCDITKRNSLSWWVKPQKLREHFTKKTLSYSEWNSIFIFGISKKRGQPHEGKFWNFLLGKNDFVNRILGWKICLCN